MTEPAAVERAVVEVLRRAGCVFPHAEARVILQAGGDPLELARRRATGQPLEAVVGWAEFAGLRLLVGPGVFIPRRRSQMLARRAARLTPAAGTMVELCCGVGPLAAVVQRERPRARVAATDIDPQATAWARRNLKEPALVLTGDLYEALPADMRGTVDVLAVNAPYVPDSDVRHLPREARDYEPHHTLAGGPDGLDLHRRLAAGAHTWLAPGGWVLIETSQRQASATAQLLREGGLSARIVSHPRRDATWVEAVSPDRTLPRAARVQ